MEKISYGLYFRSELVLEDTDYKVPQRVLDRIPHEISGEFSVVKHVTKELETLSQDDTATLAQQYYRDQCGIK